MKETITIEWNKTLHVNVPVDVPANILDEVSDILRQQAKVRRGKFIVSLKGVSNKIKFYLLKYLLITDKK